MKEILTAAKAKELADMSETNEIHSILKQIEEKAKSGHYRLNCIPPKKELDKVLSKLREYGYDVKVYKSFDDQMKSELETSMAQPITYWEQYRWKISW
jgi:N-acetyl-anhydromuramyl-L-alanine amidase AmpD